MMRVFVGPTGIDQGVVSINTVGEGDDYNGYRHSDCPGEGSHRKARADRGRTGGHTWYRAEGEKIAALLNLHRRGPYGSNVSAEAGRMKGNGGSGRRPARRPHATNGCAGELAGF